MANKLIKNTTEILSNTANVSKVYVDGKVETLSNKLADKEDIIQVLTKTEYEALTPTEKQDKTFLVTGYPDETNSLNIPTSTEISASSTDLTYPTAKAVYDFNEEKFNDYYPKTQTFNSNEVIQLIADTKSLSSKIVSTVPNIVEAKENIIYLVPGEGLKEGIYAQWMLVDGAMVMLGDTSVSADVGDGIMTLQRNAVNIGTFGANEHQSTYINIKVPVEKVNGSETPTDIYAPTSSGDSGKLLVSQGENKSPIWLSSGDNGQVLYSKGSNTSPEWGTPSFVPDDRNRQSVSWSSGNTYTADSDGWIYLYRNGSMSGSGTSVNYWYIRIQDTNTSGSTIYRYHTATGNYYNTYTTIFCPIAKGQKFYVYYSSSSYPPAEKYFIPAKTRG